MTAMVLADMDYLGFTANREKRRSPLRQKPFRVCCGTPSPFLPACQLKERTHSGRLWSISLWEMTQAAGSGGVCTVSGEEGQVIYRGYIQIGAECEVTYLEPATWDQIT